MERRDFAWRVRGGKTRLVLVVVRVMTWREALRVDRRLLCRADCAEDRVLAARRAREEVRAYLGCGVVYSLGGKLLRPACDSLFRRELRLKVAHQATPRSPLASRAA